MTAGNLFCGFVAVIRCIQAKFASSAEGMATEYADTIARTPAQFYEQAVWFILAAVVFDMLDGRMARLTQKESLFGKEFDSLADVVSFGMAPALLVFFLLLSPTADFPLVRTLGGLVGFFYLLCVAIRLARFNVITSPLLRPSENFPKHDFLGLPAPAAAGMISSIALVITRHQMTELAILLPFLLIIIALLMVSNIHYPSFKRIGSKTRIDFRTFIFVLVVIGAVFLFHYVAIALVFLTYIFYGIYRHLRKGKTANESGN
ncbi:MAG: CDP-diacylglycerol--serine O-phosphatidyltransferase [Opitutales bacterium]|nr:CDP-diacylglycerol--serine O-phosphatidyltransferase [Opitutales bacterium]